MPGRDSRRANPARSGANDKKVDIERHWRTLHRLSRRSFSLAPTARGRAAICLPPWGYGMDASNASQRPHRLRAVKSRRVRGA
jgi:hypothetical protein